MNLVVKFSGGLGNQVLSLLTAEYLRSAIPDSNVVLDLTYFDRMPGITATGKSIWGWNLDAFGISRAKLEEEFPNKLVQEAKTKLVDDSSGVKMEVAYLFKEGKFESRLLRANCLAPLVIPLVGPYYCVHVRRGDYTAVASHIIESETYVDLIRRLPKHREVSIIILSDQEIEPNIIRAAEERSSSVESHVGKIGDAPKHFATMAHSEILIAANSQYSFAASLFCRGLVFYPKKWFGKAPDNQLTEDELRHVRKANWLI